jgi:hypothetical protein
MMNGKDRVTEHTISNIFPRNHIFYLLQKEKSSYEKKDSWKSLEKVRHNAKNKNPATVIKLY